MVRRKARRILTCLGLHLHSRYIELIIKIFTKKQSTFKTLYDSWDFTQNSIHILKFIVSHETLHKINPLPWKERLRENYFSKFEMDYHFKKFEFHVTYFKYWRQGYDNDRRDLRSWFISSLFFCLKSVSQQSFNPILHTTIVSCSIIQTNTTNLGVSCKLLTQSSF